MKSKPSPDDKYPGVITYESKTGFTSNAEDQHFSLTLEAGGSTRVELTCDGHPGETQTLSATFAHEQCVSLFRFYFETLEEMPGGKTDLAHALQGISGETLRTVLQMVAAKTITSSELVACKSFLRRAEDQGMPIEAFLAQNLHERCCGPLGTAIISLMRIIDGGPRG